MPDTLRRLSVRQWSLAGLAFCALMMGVALGLEHIGGLEPCPLCIFQRVAVLAAAAVFLVAAIHNPRGRVGAALYGGLSLAAVLGGIGVAWRHLWLQSLPPDQVPSCGPGLDYMMDILPMRDVVAMVLSGSGECAEIDFLLMGISLPGWTLIGFVILAVAPLGILLGAFRQPRSSLNGSHRPA
ncbi:disulfide bond formation protein B [Halomonas daqingensis]|uniref:Disulfide bond formation protein B n=1 Tax=Billgrantia desiderata TaxID=52021 RepID=A0ABS9B1A2_9GAMM|nr:MULTISPECIES: disulfide bond formation protein B [Halomonas]MCE8030611.1 disulfide bond formation protein B [Halomonas desiderata]MCE8036752.1 disulfide bond formation protein B [Halomonas sp. MCCC 1A11062]MCE8041411.1 disulfide bond formation protein B [Halomonas desiderata]MCE8045986.1 disulfide bond formation protein B [Halomonas desiderata]NIC35117.1 disulfide bond formation protein B [Halomonas desiderata]